MGSAEEAKELVQQIGQQFLAHYEGGGVHDSIRIHIAGLDGHHIVNARSLPWQSAR